jgi:hypothetical protein
MADSAPAAGVEDHPSVPVLGPGESPLRPGVTSLQGPRHAEPAEHSSPVERSTSSGCSARHCSAAHPARRWCPGATRGCRAGTGRTRR